MCIIKTTKNKKNKAEQQAEDKLFWSNRDSDLQINNINSTFSSAIECLSVLSRIRGEMPAYLSNTEILNMLDKENSEHLWPSDWILKAQIEFKIGEIKRCLESVDSAMAGFLKSSEHKNNILMCFATLYGLLGEKGKALDIIKTLPSRYFHSILLFDVDFLIKLGAREILVRDVDCMNVCCEFCVCDYIGLLSVYEKLGLEDKFDTCLQNAITATNENPHALNYGHLALMLKKLNRDGIDKYLAMAGEFTDSLYDSVELAFLHLLISDNRNVALNCVRCAVEDEDRENIFSATGATWDYLVKYLLKIDFLTFNDLRRLKKIFSSVILEGMDDINILKYIERCQSYYSINIARNLFLTLDCHENAAKCLSFMQEKTVTCSDLYHCLTVCHENGIHSEAKRCINEIKKLAVNVSDYCTLSKGLAVLKNTEAAVLHADIAEKKASDIKDLENCLNLWFDLGSNDGVRRCKRKIQKLKSGRGGLLDPLMNRLDEFASIIKNNK